MTRSDERKVSLREDLFHKLFNHHRQAAMKALSQLLPLVGMQEVSSEIFPEKVPDKVYQSANWDEDPRLFVLDLTIEVEPDDVYKLNTYRSWGLEHVARRLPRRRKYHEPEERVHGALLSILSPDDNDRSLANKYHVELLSLQEGLPLDLPPSGYVEVGAPFVLGRICWLKHRLTTEEWLQELREAARMFRDDENEVAFLLGWGKILLPSGSEANYIKDEIDKLIREELQMSSTAVVRKVLQAWDVPPEESKIIERVLEGMDAEQRKIVLAALEGMDAEQRKIVLAALEGMDAEQRKIVLAALEGMDAVKKQVFLRMLDLPSEKLQKMLKLLEDPARLERMLNSVDD